MGWSLVATSFFALGCAPDRCKLDNDELSMVARVVDFGAAVRVEIDLAEGERSQIPIPWRTCDGDRILVNGQDTSELAKDDRTEYVRTFEGEAPETINIEIDRAGDQFDVVEASVMRPPPFEITGPANGDTLARSEEHLLTWAPPREGEQMQIELREEIGGGLCIVTALEEHDYKGEGGVRVDDDGDWRIPAGVLTNDGVDECRASYSLRRFEQGEYPEAFAAGGFVEAEVVRIVAVRSTP